MRRQVQRSRDGSGMINGPTKNKKSRTIRLGGVAIDALKTHRDSQAEEVASAKGLWRDPNLVFASTIGTSLDPSNLVSRSFKPLLGRAGLPIIRFHDLRHPTPLRRGSHKGGAGGPRPLQRLGHHGHVLTRPARYAGEGRCGDGRATLGRPVTVKVTVKSPRGSSGGISSTDFLPAKLKKTREPTSGLEPLTPALATSALSYVYRCFSEFQDPHTEGKLANMGVPRISRRSLRLLSQLLSRHKDVDVEPNLTAFSLKVTIGVP